MPRTGLQRHGVAPDCDAQNPDGLQRSAGLGVVTVRLWAFATGLLLLTVAPTSLAASDAGSGPPTSRESLFDDTDAAGSPPKSRESLFDDTDAATDKGGGSGTKLSGFAEVELAYTTPSPAHWSRLLTRLQLDATGAFSPDVNWKLSGRVDYDAVYNLTNFYLPSVADNARLNFFARENYLDIGANDWDFRLGRQHIVWGEMVGLFAADVVSAKDLREFILPDFAIVRIPQWATRAEYSKNDFHAELVWIPIATYNKIGVPGAQFYSYPPAPPPGFAEVIQDEQFPSNSLSHTNYGVRLSLLRNGWDVAGYYYGSMDQSPTFFRTIVNDPQPTFVYQPRHDRINQGGFTLAKDFGFGVLKAETVYTQGRKYNVNTLSTPDGLVSQNTVDWVVGFDFSLPALPDTRLNVQGIQRIYLNYDSGIGEDVYGYAKYENGYSVYTSTQFGQGWEATMQWAASLNRNDWMLRLSLARTFEKNWRAQVGVDLFDGSPQSLFGQYSNSKRVYGQLFYSF